MQFATNCQSGLKAFFGYCCSTPFLRVKSSERDPTKLHPKVHPQSDEVLLKSVRTPTRTRGFGLCSPRQPGKGHDVVLLEALEERPLWSIGYGFWLHFASNWDAFAVIFLVVGNCSNHRQIALICARKYQYLGCAKIPYLLARCWPLFDLSVLSRKIAVVEIPDFGQTGFKKLT